MARKRHSRETLGASSAPALLLFAPCEGPLGRGDKTDDDTERIVGDILMGRCMGDAYLPAA
jgi:hypothetical protein